MNDLGFGITLALKDLFTKNAKKIEQSYKSLDGTIADSSDKINKNLERVQKGAMLVGAGVAALSIPAALASSTLETQKALGEMRSLGIKDLNALAQAAEDFSNQWAGTTKPEFISASYDIKSGIATLSDFSVGEFTKVAALTGKATKSTTAEMTSLFATGYGIYKTMYDKMSDEDFAAMLSGGISAAVRDFKTTGSGMAESISRMGAIATTAKIPMEEQLAVLGMLQATMSGSEAGTKYKAFMKSAAGAGNPADRGTTCGGYKEADLVLKYATIVFQELTSKGYEAFLITSGTYAERHAWVNQHNIDLYLACHLNAGGGNYSLIEYLYNAGQQTKKLAKIMVDNFKNILCTSEGKVLEIAKGARGESCIINTRPSALLLEPAFIDNEKHLEIAIKNPELIAQAIVNILLIKN